jgi:uncharacterized protein (TIRG00374 family)
MSRTARVLATVLVTGLAIAYLIWKVDISAAIDVLADVDLGYLLLTVAIMVVTVFPMAWRWRLLLDAKGVRDRLGWLTRAYFVGYAAGQVLPTAVGGDAVRIYETARRHPGQGGTVAGSVLLERAIGGAATLALAAVGFVLALGRYDVGAYLWIEAVFVLGTLVLAVVFFSRRARGPLRRVAPLLARVRLERPARAVYEGIHSYRTSGRVLLLAFALTLAIQAVRVLALWTAGEAVGIDLSPLPYFVMGPLLFLVMLVPFTLNGFAVREAFFVSFLGTLGIPADKAFAAGFLFFLVTIALALPGAAILAWENLRAPATAEPRHG